MLKCDFNKIAKQLLPNKSVSIKKLKKLRVVLPGDLFPKILYPIPTKYFCMTFMYNKHGHTSYAYMFCCIFSVA